MSGLRLIGRTRTGKSTIKSLLMNPTNVLNELTLKSDTNEPHFQAFHLEEDDVVLNIIDTPDLFQENDKKLEIRDNKISGVVLNHLMNISNIITNH